MEVVSSRPAEGFLRPLKSLLTSQRTQPLLRARLMRPGPPGWFLFWLTPSCLITHPITEVLSPRIHRFCLHLRWGDYMGGRVCTMKSRILGAISEFCLPQPLSQHLPHPTILNHKFAYLSPYWQVPILPLRPQHQTLIGKRNSSKYQMDKQTHGWILSYYLLVEPFSSLLTSISLRWKLLEKVNDTFDYIQCNRTENLRKEK